MDELKRLDPIDCGCTDCMTGYSKPIDMASDEELCDAYLGKLDNASSQKLILESKITYK